MQAKNSGGQTEMSEIGTTSSRPLNEQDALRTRNGASNGDNAAANRTYKTMATNNEAAPITPDMELDVKIEDPRDRRRRQQQGQAAPTTTTQPTGSREPPPPPPTENNDEEGGDENIEEMEEEIVLKYGAAHVIKLFIPVTLCLVFVILSLSLIKSYQKSDGATLIYTPFNEASSDSGGTKLWMSIANASIFIAVVVVMTILLIVLYKFSCYKLIHGWLAFSSLMLLFFFTYMYISEIFKQFNLVTDMFTVSIFLWNFGVVGMFAIHWKGPLFLQQCFLIFSCVQMALIFIKYLPDWTTWVLLAFISIWDLIAVLCPFGPLRILVETAKKRNDNLFPAMVYSSAVMYTIMANADTVAAATNTNGRRSSTEEALNNNRLTTTTRTTINGDVTTTATESDDGGFRDAVNQTTRQLTGDSGEHETIRHRTAPNRRPGAGEPISRSSRALEHIEQLEHQQQEEEENGVKLGLGDFIFYSILVGKASILGDWNTVIACFVAILIGLCMTLVLLAIFHKPLPALPISLLFGLIFYFSTNLIVRPFYDNLTYKQVFI